MTPQLEAALNRIQPGMTVSLGGGRHMQQLAEAIHGRQLAVTLASPSPQTRAYGAQLGLPIANSLSHYDIAFDGCDCVDAALNLLKSGGGIHLDEKLAAMAADDYVILVAEAKVHPLLDPAVPMCVEVMPQALPRVADVASAHGLALHLRQADNFMGPTFTRHGNVLVDLQARDWQDIAAVDAAVVAIPGVVATSYFAGLATRVLAEAADGTVNMMEAK